MNESSIKDHIVDYLHKNGPSYTRDLYLSIGGKKKSGITLNKFREILRSMLIDGLVDYSGGKLPKWST